jgi:hypothetical protein
MDYGLGARPRTPIKIVLMAFRQGLIAAIYLIAGDEREPAAITTAAMLSGKCPFSANDFLNGCGDL